MAVGDVITGLLTSIIHDGLRRPFRGIADAYHRKQAINKALMSEATTHRHLLGFLDVAAFYAEASEAGRFARPIRELDDSLSASLKGRAEAVYPE